MANVFEAGFFIRGFCGVADETEADGAGPRIENANDFAKWLKKAQPAPDICVALAARAALRGLPFTFYSKLKHGPLSAAAMDRATSRIFRATAASLTTAKYPRQMKEFDFQLNAAINYAVSETRVSNNTTQDLFWSAANAAKAAKLICSNSINAKIDNSFILDSSNLSGKIRQIPEILDEIYHAVCDAVDDASKGIAFSVSYFSKNDEGLETTPDEYNIFFDASSLVNTSAAADYRSEISKFIFWETITSDTRLVSSRASAQRIADMPLWRKKPPIFVSNHWRALKDFLPETDNWQVWKNWYEDILNGTAHSEAHDLIYATVPVEEWDKGPAAANKWIADRLAELGENTSSSDINFKDFPKPLENIPSLFTFGLNDAGQIDVVAGPQNTPVIGFTGDEATHRQWLETARELARRLAADLRDDKFGNVRRDYADALVRYVDDLPREIGEGNFLLADHEIIAIHDLFGAEAAILPEALAARLNRVLNAHYSLLDFYPETKRYHEAAQKGRLGPPAPEEAFAGFEKIVREFTPEIFAPRVTQEIEAANYEAPRVEIDEEDRKLHAAIDPAPYPYEHDSLNERHYERASTINALWKPLYYLLKNPDKTESSLNLWDKCRPLIEQILNFITS